MESMSQAPYLLPNARFGFRMGDVKALDAMVHDGLTNPFTRQADVPGGHRGRRRAGDDPRRHGPLGAALARAHDRRHRRGPAPRGDRPRDGQGPEGRHGRRGRRGAAPRLVARGAGQAARPARQGGLAHGRQLAGRQRRRRRARGRLRRVGRARGQGDPRHDRRPGGGRRRLRLPRPHARQRGQARAREGRAAAGRHRPVGDQRGVRIRDAELDPDARASTRTRVNVNGGAVAIGHPIGASGARILASLVHELRRRGGGYGCAAICSGGGQGDAVIVQV